MSFSTSYSQVGDTTGYSSNKGVWSKVMFQQKQGPFTKKRKKWYQSFGGDPSIYQISERDEEEDIKFPQIIVADQGISVPIIETTPKRKTFIKDRNPSIPQIVVEDCYQDTDNISQRSVIRETSANSAFLMPPTVKKNKPLCARKVPEAAVYNSFYSSSTQNKENKPEVDKRGKWYVASPKYTHIRVPQRQVLITHVSQESLDFPLKLPHIGAHLSHQRKPVNITLSKIGKSSLRKRWNSGSPSNPVQIYTSPQPSDSNATESSTVKTASAGKDRTENNQEPDHARRAFQNIVNTEDNKSLSSVCKKHTTKNGAVGVRAKPTKRKKWVLLEHWPSKAADGGPLWPSQSSDRGQ